MARLTLHLLGTPQVRLDGAPSIDFPTDKARALLFYLAMHAGDLLRRDTLVGLFWPDQPQKKARHNLRQTLFHLRRVVGDPEDGQGFLRVTREAVCFDAASDYFLDVGAFKERLTLCQGHAHRRLLTCRPCMRQLEEAVALYRGELLSGFYLRDCAAFEEWALLEQEWLHRQVVKALALLSRYYELRGDYRQVEHYAGRQVQLEPWNEEAHQRLMLLLAASGERGAALAQYEKCRQTLADTLGVAPTADTTALYEQIRAGAGLRLPAPAHRLVPEPTSFVGREEELAKLDELLADPNCRLVTLVGPGGVGKTRLARAAAAAQEGAFAHGVYDVSLAAIDSPVLIVPAIADALGFSFYGPRGPREQLADYLRGKEMLLLLDSMEHLLEGGDLLSYLLAHAPDLIVMVTSRERLNLREEWVYEVGGLAYPEAAAEGLEQYSAVALFAQRARQSSRHFDLAMAAGPAVVRICQLVEGLPLGIELAAASVAACSCGDIAQAIERNLHALTTPLRNVPERHRSIGAALEHSWRLLSPEGRQSLAQLSVLRGGFDAATAQQVAAVAPGGLAALVHASMIRVDAAGSYTLHPLVRQYAAEKLAAQPAVWAQTHGRHSAYYAGLVQHWGPRLGGPETPAALLRLRIDLENVRAAWRWAVAQGCWTEIDRSVEGLARFYLFRGPLQEGQELLGEAVAGARGGPADTAGPLASVEPLLLAHLLAEQARLLNEQGQYRPAAAAVEEALQWIHTVPAGAAGALTPAASLEPLCAMLWGRALMRQGDYPAAQAHLEQALVSPAPAGSVQAEALRNLGAICFFQGNYPRAQDHFQRSLAICRQRADRHGEAAALNNLGSICFQEGHVGQAREYYEQALRVRVELGDRWGESSTLSNLGVLLGEGAAQDRDAALHYFERSLEIAIEVGDRWGQGMALLNLGSNNRARRAYPLARRCLEQAGSIFRELGDRRGEGLALSGLGSISTQLGAYAQARSELEKALQTLQELGDRRGEGEVLTRMGTLCQLLGDCGAMQRCGQQALAAAEETGDVHVRGYALTLLGHAHAGQGQLLAAAAAYRQAVDVCRETGAAATGLDPRAGLAHVALAQGESEQALAHVEEILAGRDHLALDGAVEPFHVYLTCYQVLRAARDPRAAGVLAAVSLLLQECTAQIGDEEARRFFLEEVPVHHEIAAAGGR